MIKSVRSKVPVALLLAVCGCELGEDGDEGAPPEVCSTQETSLVDEGENMEPGGDCIFCHASDEGPRYTIAGTVMGALDDDDRCAGVDGVTVEITDANGQVISLTTNAVGNFFYQGELASPYSAKVRRGDQEVAMASAQSSGDCASCHTAQGVSGAPGRIVAP